MNHLQPLERQRHALDVIFQARQAHDRRRQRAALVVTVALIGAMIVLGAALAGAQ